MFSSDIKQVKKGSFALGTAKLSTNRIIDSIYKHDIILWLTLTTKPTFFELCIGGVHF